MPSIFPVQDVAAEASLATLAANTPPVGQKPAAACSPVVLASDQALPLPSGAATAANQTAANTSLAALVTGQGADGTGITPPTGGSGLRGWVSGIYKTLTGTLATVDGNLTPCGYQQITNLTAATSLTVPAGARVAAIQAESGTIRYRDDGTAPTATVGMVISANGGVNYTGSLAGVQLIAATAGAVANVSYYK